MLNNLLGANIGDELTFVSVTHWGTKTKETTLKPSNLEKIARTYSWQFKIINIGHQTYNLNLYNNFHIYLCCSQEIRTKQGLHITAEACDRLLIPEGIDARKTVELIHKANGKAILEHPFTIDDPLIKYRLLFRNFDRDKIKLIHELLHMVDGVEVFNSMNTLYMFISNVLAKDLVSSFERINRIYVPKLAGGDEHFNPIGNTGNLLPKEDLSKATGKEIQEWRWKQYKQGNFKRKRKITSPLTFFKYMVLKPN